MLRMLIGTLTAAVLLLGGCAVTKLATPSGRPEVTISASRSQVKSALIETFLSKGWQLTSDQDSSMLFVIAMDSGNAVVYQSLLGNAYSSHPEWEARVAMADTAGGIRVFASSSTVMQNAFGQTGRNDMTSGKSGLQLQSMLESVKISLEDGDASRNRGRIGASHTNQIVMLVAPGGPAAKAGLRSGDRIISANGSLLNGELIHDHRLLGGTPGSTVVLVVERNGTERTVEVVRGSP